MYFLVRSYIRKMMKLETATGPLSLAYKQPEAITELNPHLVWRVTSQETANVALRGALFLGFVLS